MHVRNRRDAFDALISSLYAAALDAALWPAALTATSDYLGAIGGMLVRNDPQHGRGWIVVGRLRQDLSNLYLTRYVDNPYSRAVVGQPGGRLLRANSLVDLPAMRRTAFHTDMLVPQGIADLVVLPYAPWQCGPTTGGIAFALGARLADAPEGDLRRRHARIVPHLLRAMDLSAACGAGAALTRNLQAVLDAAPGAAMLLSAAGHLLHANPAAEALLREGDGLQAGRRIGDGCRLHAAHARDDQGLARMVGQAALVASGGEAADTAAADRAGPGAAMSVRIARPSGRPDLLLCAVPLPAGAPPWAGQEAPSVLLFLLQPGALDGPHMAAPVPAALFGLTPAEARVAASVGSGLGLPETARRLGVSVETARTQLRRCFAKTETRSQADLARLIASLPAARAAQ